MFIPKTATDNGAEIFNKIKTYEGKLRSIDPKLLGEPRTNSNSKIKQFACNLFYSISRFFANIFGYTSYYMHFLEEYRSAYKLLSEKVEQHLTNSAEAKDSSILPTGAGSSITAEPTISLEVSANVNAQAVTVVALSSLSSADANAASVAEVKPIISVEVSSTVNAQAVSDVATSTLAIAADEGSTVTAKSPTSSQAVVVENSQKVADVAISALAIAGAAANTGRAIAFESRASTQNKGAVPDEDIDEILDLVESDVNVERESKSKAAFRSSFQSLAENERSNFGAGSAAAFVIPSFTFSQQGASSRSSSTTTVGSTRSDADLYSVASRASSRSGSITSAGSTRSEYGGAQLAASLAASRRNSLAAVGGMHLDQKPPRSAQQRLRYGSRAQNK